MALADGVPGDHIHYDEHNFLAEGSTEMIIDKLEALLGNLIEDAGSHSGVSANPFLEEIYRYCEWIGYEEYEALESGHIQFDDYSAYCKERILPVLNEHPQLKTILLDLLNSIKQSMKPTRTEYSAGTMRIFADLKRCIHRTFSCSILRIATGSSM